MKEKHSKKILQNQVNPPNKSKWNEKCWKVYFKHDGCSMLLFDNLTGVNAMIRVKTLSRLYNAWKGKFIVTK